MFEEELGAARRYQAAAQSALAGRLEGARIDEHQRAAHGFAWIATSVAALEAVAAWAGRSGDALDETIARLAFAETLGQLVGGLPMGQNEILRPVDLGLNAEARVLAQDCADLLETDHANVRAQVVSALAAGQWPSESLGDHVNGGAKVGHSAA